MRNLVFGGIGLVIGLALLIGSLTSGSTRHSGGAYGSGVSAGEVSRIPIAVIFLLASIWTIRRGLQQRRSRSTESAPTVGRRAQG